MNSKTLRLLAVLALAVTTLGAGIASSAVLTNSAKANLTDTALTVSLTVNDQTTLTVAPRLWTDINTKQYIPIVVKSTGSSGIRYSVKSTITSPNTAMDTSLLATVHTNSDPSRCTISEFGALGTTNVVDVHPSQLVMGDPATGQQSGDRVLAAGASELWCLQLVYATQVTDPTPLGWQLTFSAETTQGT